MAIAGAGVSSTTGGTSATSGSGGASGSTMDLGAGASTASAGRSAAAGSAGAVPPFPPPPIDCKPWPQAGETVQLAATLEVSGVLDAGMKRYVGVGALAGEGQAEDMPPMMRLAPGSVLKNAVIGKPASDGIHCDGTCYLQNVWWEDVGEDAATLDGNDAKQTMTIECAGARHASDKVYQHNGPGTFVLTNLYVEDFNKLYRSCGNCKTQFERHAKLSNIIAEDGKLLVGINENYDDSATFSNISAESGIDICATFEGNSTGDEPRELGDGPDPRHCLYQSSDIDQL